jgi:hypothetical protein
MAALDQPNGGTCRMLLRLQDYSASRSLSETLALRVCGLYEYETGFRKAEPLQLCNTFEFMRRDCVHAG